MKRATFMVTNPSVGQSIYQELPGCVDAKLRSAIKKAEAAFRAEYFRKTEVKKAAQ